LPGERIFGGQAKIVTRKKFTLRESSTYVTRLSHAGKMDKVGLRVVFCSGRWRSRFPLKELEEVY